MHTCIFFLLSFVEVNDGFRKSSSKRDKEEKDNIDVNDLISMAERNRQRRRREDDKHEYKKKLNAERK